MINTEISSNDFYMKEYVVGFVFDQSYGRVLLIHKNRPQWQKGGLNGLGGLISTDESAEEAVSRKVNNEANLVTPTTGWSRVGEVRKDGDVIYFLFITYSGKLDDATTMKDEQVEWFSLNDLPDNIVPDSLFFLHGIMESGFEPEKIGYVVKE